MSLTALQLIESSMRLIGVLSTGQASSASEATDGLASLNSMVDNWSTQGLLIPNKTSETFPLVASQQVYTMGVGGDFDTSRPMSLIRASIQLATESPVVDLPMDILTMEQYAGIIIKTITSTFPLYLYSDNANPLTNISVWPVPTNSSNNLVLYTLKPLADISTLDATITLPPGYLEALKYNLAIRLSPEYGKMISPDISGIAETSKADIKRVNHRTRFLQVDNSIRSSGGTYNWRTDGYEL